MNYTKDKNHPLKRHGRWTPWISIVPASVACAGTLFALSEILETDTDNDGWTDVEEIAAGTDFEDPADPWDSDEDGIADYLEFENGTDPLDHNDPAKATSAPVYAGTQSAVAANWLAADSAGAEEVEDIEKLGLGNADFNAPSGFDDGKKEESENGRKIQYRIMGGDAAGWSALVGSGIEYWKNGNGGTIGVELCAGLNSRGIKQRFQMEATKEFCGGYALVWEHYGRVPRSGEINYDYTVRVTIGDPSTGTAKNLGSEQLVESVVAGETSKECFFFGISEEHLDEIAEKGLWISMRPQSSGTLSAVVSKLRIVKICMAVDNNRDGNISFGGEDLTSKDNPYRFWINNDCDDEAFYKSWINDDGDNDGISDDNVSKLDRSGTNDPDFEDDAPNSLRDLEDFSRLQVLFSGEQETVDWLFGKLKEDKVKFVLAPPPSSGDGVKINFMQHLDPQGGLGYLDGDYSGDLESQLRAEMWTSLPSNLKGCDDGSSEGVLGWFAGTLKPIVRSEVLNRQGNQLNFLFEGVQTGKGKFTLLMARGENPIQETASVWLELLDVREMFEQVQIVESQEGEYSWQTKQHGTFESPRDEEGKQIVFVHGWNMEEGGTASYAEISFKRLWWQNYKGRFSSVYWPTGTSLLSYMPSEFKAWKCGSALKDYVNSLKDKGRSVNVMAHSMGNIVVGSALKEGAEIGVYALLNAAIPAECYDDREVLRQNPYEKNLGTYGMKFANLVTNTQWSSFDAWAKPSVGDDSNKEISALGYRGFLKDVSCTMVNFYLPEDSATEDAWEFNNSTQKPWDGVGWTSSYSYTPGHIPTCRNEFFIKRNVTDGHEVMAYVDSSKTKVAGTECRMKLGNGPIESINMGDEDPDSVLPNFEDSHSAQFVWRLQKTWQFWKMLGDKLDK